jgi:glycerol-3-phosphate dehydrogenase
LARLGSHEGALHLDDVLARRTRLSIETWDRAVGASRPAAEIVAPILGWDAATLDNEVEHYHQRVEAERTSQTMPDDESADHARLRARTSTAERPLGPTTPPSRPRTTTPSRTGTAAAAASVASSLPP